MKKFRSISLLLVLVLALGVFAGCNKAQEDPKEEVKVEENQEESTQVVEEEGPYTVVDMMDREVSFETVPEKVITITPSDAENLHAIGASDKIIGIGTYVDYPETVVSLPVVASGSDMNAEEIIALEPDLVLMSDMAQTEEQVKTLTDAGINVVLTNSGTIEDVYKAIDLLGKTMKKEAEAEKVIADMKAELEAIKANAVDNAGKSVYFEISPLEYGLWSAGNGTFMDEVAEIVGVENIFSDIEGWGEVSEEQVISKNPNYIVTISMGTTTEQTPIEEIMGRPGWEEISAVKDSKILNLVDDELSRPSVRLVEGAKALAEFVK